MVTAAPMRLLHLANFGSNNIGNGALIHGLERVLREDSPGEIDFVPEPWDEYTLRDTRRFDAEFTRRVNDHDALLVGGAVMMIGMRRYWRTGSRFDVSDAFWKDLDRPVVFYSVASSNRRNIYHHRDAFRRFIEERILGNEKVLFSVRNDGTKPWIEEILGYASDEIIEVPDPALYVPTQRSDHPEIEPGMRNLVLSLNIEGQVLRFGGRPPLRLTRHLPGWKKRKKHFLQSVAKVMDELFSDHGVNVILCPHCPSDLKIVAEFLDECSTELHSYGVVVAGLPRAEHAARFYDLYRSADFAVSMRIHSLTCAIGLGVPTIAIGEEERAGYSMDRFGVAEWYLDPMEDDFEARLRSGLQRLVTSTDKARSTIEQNVERMRVETRSFNERVNRFIRGDS